MSAKPTFGDPDYHPIWSNLSWEKTPRLVVVNLAKLIPKAGGTISAILDKIWPSGDSVDDLIKASEERMKAWVNGQFAAYDRKLLSNIFAGLQSNLKEYVRATQGTNREQKATWQTACIQAFNGLQNLFTNPLDHVGVLPLAREFAFAHIEILRDRVEFATEIYGEGVNQSGFADTLSETIARYQKYFLETACPAVMAWRRDQIAIHNPEGIGGNPHFRLIDTGREVKGDIYRGGRDVAEQYRAYYLNEIDIHLQENIRDVVQAWSLRDPKTAGKDPLPKNRVTWIGPVGISQWNFLDNQHGFPLNQGLRSVQSPIVHILIKHGVIVDFIWVRDGGSQYEGTKRRGLMVGNDKGGAKAQFQVPAGQYIRAVDTYWNYTCMAIEFHYTNGTSSGRFGLGDNRPSHKHQATYGGDHILQSVAIYGSAKGLSEFHFGFVRDPRSA